MKKRGMFVQSHSEELSSNPRPRAVTLARPIGLPIRDDVDRRAVSAVDTGMDAQSIAAQLRALLAQVEQQDAAPTRMLSEVAADWLVEAEATRKETTLKGIRCWVRDLVREYGDRQVSGSWRNIAVEIIARRKETPAAAMHRVVTLGAILRWANQRRERPDPPDFVDLEQGTYKPGKRKPYTPEHLRRILATLDEREIEQGLITAPVIRLLVFCPMRASEACGLRWEWLDLDAGRIHLPDSKTGPRTVPFGAEARRLLELQGPKERGPVFPGKDGSVAYQSIYMEFVRTRETAAVSWGGLHFLRHTWSKISSKLGISTAVRAAVLGHSTQGMTDSVYTDVDDEDLDDAMSRVEDAILGRRAESMKH